MKIQQKFGSIMISTGDVKVLVGDSLNVKADEADIFIGRKVELKGDAADKMIVTDPGEYEAHGVMVQAVPAPGSDDIQFFSVDAENVNLVFLESTSKNIAKKATEQVGLNNILIARVTENFDNLHECVNDFDPNILVPLCNNPADYAEIAKKLGVMAAEAPQKNLTVTADDFDNDLEEAPLKLITLES